MADTVNSKPSFLHMIQAFLVDVVQHLHDTLPEGAEVLRTGRTIASGVIGGQSFRVRLSLSQFEDDMWPHVDAEVTLGDGPSAQAEQLDFHPDLTAHGHAEKIAKRLSAMIDG